MSDKESDGPQKSHAKSWDMPNELDPEFVTDDEVQIAKGKNGKPLILTVAEHRWKDGEHQYRLKDKNGKFYSDKQGKEWFSEDKLEHAE